MRSLGWKEQQPLPVTNDANDTSNDLKEIILGLHITMIVKKKIITIVSGNDYKTIFRNTSETSLVMCGTRLCCRGCKGKRNDVKAKTTKVTEVGGLPRDEVLGSKG